MNNKSKSFGFYIRKPTYTWQCEYCKFTDKDKSIVDNHEKSCKEK